MKSICVKEWKEWQKDLEMKDVLLEEAKDLWKVKKEKRKQHYYHY